MACILVFAWCTWVVLPTSRHIPLEDKVESDSSFEQSRRASYMRRSQGEELCHTLLADLYPQISVLHV